MLINIALENFFSIFVEKWIWKENETVFELTTC